MRADPSERHEGRLILRDYLAENRTSLANERTLLAYIRTSLALFAAGITFIRFFGLPLITAIGWLLIPLSAITLLKGMFSFRKTNRIMREEERSAAENSGSGP